MASLSLFVVLIIFSEGWTKGRMENIVFGNGTFITVAKTIENLTMPR